MKKKHILFISLIILLLTCSGCLSILQSILSGSAREMIKELKFEIYDVGSFSIGTANNPFEVDKVNFTVKMKVRNLHNTVSVILESLDFDLLLNNNKAADLTPRPNKTIKSGGEYILPIDVTVSLSKLANVTIDALRSGNINYALTGNYKVKALGQTFNFSTKIYGN